MDERLRLVVELQNKASAELRKLSHEMGGVRQTPGMVSAANWFQKLEGASTASSKAIRPLVGGLNMVGVSGLAAGLSVAGLISQFRDLAKAMPALQELSRQTGMSRTEIERLKQTASNLNVDPSRMTAGISAFSRMMVEFHKRTGAVYEEMVNHGAAGLAEKIRQENPAAAFKDTLQWLNAIPAAAQRAGKSVADSVQIQRHWTGEALGDEDLAQLFGKGAAGLGEAYQQAAQDVGQITDEMVRQSEAFDRSITRFDRSWTNLKNDLGATVLPGLTAATDGMRALFDEVKRDPELIGIGAASLGALYVRRRAMRAVSGRGGAGISPATAAKVETAAVEQKTASASFAEAVAEFRAGVVEFRGRGPGGTSGAGSTEPDKPAGKSPGYASLAPGGLLALYQAYDVAANAPGLDEAGQAQREANSRAGDALGDGIKAATGGVFGTDALRDRIFGKGRDVTDVIGDWWKGRSSTPATLPAPASQAFHTPAAYDREQRARMFGDGQDHSLDGVVVGALDRPVQHLVGTLKTAAAAIDGNVRPAAFHPAALGGAALGSDPVALLAAGTKAGFLAAFRELQGSAASDGAGGGFMPASFGGGRLGGGYSASAAGGRAPSIRFGRQHSSAPFDGGGATPTGAHDPLKDLIAAHETGGTGAAGYDTVYGHAERGGPLAPPKPITQMTIAEVLAYQRAMKPRAGSPAFPVGRAQWTESTLRGLTRGMDPGTVFSAEVQEKLFDRSIAGRLGQGPGGFRSEWDSLRAVPDGEIERAMQGHREALRSAPPTASAAGSGVSTAAKGAYPAWMDERSRREMAGINAPLARDLLAASEATGLHFRITQGLRTAEEAAHNALTGRGVFNSQHRWGAAADLVMQDAQGHDIQDRSAYKTFADAFAAHSRATGGHSRWLGDLPGRWGSDIVHFDQGIGYGQTHQRDPYGSGGPTAADIAAGNKEIFSGPANPFLRAAHPIERAAEKLKDAVAPLPEIRPVPSGVDAGGGQRVQIDPIEMTVHHRQDGRTRIAAKAGRGVNISIRTAPTLVQTA